MFALLLPPYELFCLVSGCVGSMAENPDTMDGGAEGAKLLWASSGDR
jgi:hypothetical protein